MRYSTTAIIFIIIIVIFSIFVANFANIISSDSEFTKKMHESFENNKVHNKNQKFLQIDDKKEHLMWFVQVINQ